MTARSIKNVPFCWQSKATLRRIADACDGRVDRAFVTAVYVALTWIASDEESSVFTAPKSQIAARAGVSYRKAADVLTFLERLGVIAVSANVIAGTRELGPNTYTLGTPGATSGTGCLRLGTDAKQASVPRLEKNVLEESLELAAPAAPERDSGKKTKAPRARNELLDAIVAIDGSNPTEVTGSAWGAAAKALAEIKEVCADVTPTEIARRAANYRSHFAEAAISPNALSKHWARCQHAGATSANTRPEATVRRINLSET